MARRKFRHQRHEPPSERSFQEYLTTPAPQTSHPELMTLVRGGEDTFLELKVKLSNPERIAQGIVALANTGGGVIVFGVNDNLRVEGLDDAEAVRDELVRICRESVVPPLFPFVDIVAFDSRLRVVAIEVEGKRRPYRTTDGRYFVRVGAEKREASREEMSALLDEARPLGQENVAAVGAEVEDVDEAHLWSFVREFGPDAFAPTRARADYHRGARAEGLANALVHRDLVLPGVATRLFVFDHSIEVTNPRRTSGFAPAAQRAIRYGVPQRLNPQIAAVFTSPAYGLRLPTGGLPMLLRESRLFSGRKTEIHAFNDEFRLRPYGV